MKMMKYVWLVLMIGLMCCGKTPSVTKTVKVKGGCMHPAINGGMPFPLNDQFVFNSDSTLTVNTPGGVSIFLTGATCAFTRESVNAN